MLTVLLFGHIKRLVISFSASSGEVAVPLAPSKRSTLATLLRKFPPSRIVCLTQETVETLYLLGEQDRIVAVSGYAVRPPQVRHEKPRFSAFTSADIPKILALKPDLVLTFPISKRRSRQS
jgi:ABC-type Fe3+-hydroxamate transport system substrate-binding protein